MMTDTHAGEASRRARGDLCPGALRPWPADDGMLVRLRLVGGHLPVAALARLQRVSQQYGDGRIHLTVRPGDRGQLTPEVVAAIESTGLLPACTHELVRNIVVSPQSGLAGSRTDLRLVAARLDALSGAAPDPWIPSAAPPLGFGAVPGGTHVPIPGGVLSAATVESLIQRAARPGAE